MSDRSATRAAGLALLAVSCCLALPLLVAAGMTASVGAAGTLAVAAAAVAIRGVIAKRNAKETLVRRDQSAPTTVDRWTHRAANNPARPLVEILYFDGCPNQEGARVLVERVSREIGVEPELRLVNVPDEQAARRLRFLGSPAIGVSGEDVDPQAGERNDYVLSCRVYRTDHGFAGQPDERWVRDALARAASKDVGGASNVT